MRRFPAFLPFYHTVKHYSIYHVVLKLLNKILFSLTLYMLSAALLHHKQNKSHNYSDQYCKQFIKCTNNAAHNNHNPKYSSTMTTPKRSPPAIMAIIFFITIAPIPCTASAMFPIMRKWITSIMHKHTSHKINRVITFISMYILFSFPSIFNYNFHTIALH